MRALLDPRCVAAVAGILALAAPAAGVSFVDDFEVDPSADWTVNTAAGTDSAANFFLDYSSVGIPSAPGGTGTRGLKLQANLSAGVFGGMSVSPNGQSFAGDHKLRFDWWANVNGPFPIGGSGSANLSTFGIGTAGASPQWPGGTQDSVWFGATGDGNSSADWRAYSTAEPVGYADGDPVYAAPTRNGSDPYYAGFGSNTAPVAQIALFPQQSGTTSVGSSGMEWHRVLIERAGTTVTWSVDGLLIATVDLTSVVLGGGNIFFGHSDTNTTSSADPNDADLLFTLIDNVRVVPAPAAPGLLLAAGLTLALRRRR